MTCSRSGRPDPMARLFHRSRPLVTLIVPARFGSSRFPGKPLAVLRGANGAAKPLIQRVWETARQATGVDRLLVATDNRSVADAVRGFGGEVVMTSPNCRNGTERCAEAIDKAGIGDGVVVNLQGDAPLTPPATIEALIATMAADPGIAVSSPMLRCPTALVERLVAAERTGVPGGTTVVTDRRGDALYFSRRVLPWFAGDPGEAPVYMHCGAYAYRTAALARYAAIPPTVAERLEGLEQLRFLHAGIAIRMVTMAEPPGGLWEVNHPADIELVEAGLRVRGLS